MKRILFLLLIAPLIAISLVAPYQVKAQSGPTWCYFLDFRQTDYGAIYDSSVNGGYGGQYQFPGYGILNGGGAALFSFSNQVSVDSDAITFNFAAVHGLHDNIDILIHSQPFGLHDPGLSSEVTRYLTMTSFDQTASVTVTPSGAGEFSPLFKMYFAANDDVYLTSVMLQGSGFIDPFYYSTINGQSPTPCAYETATPTPTSTPSLTPSQTFTPSQTLTPSQTFTASATPTSCSFSFDYDFTANDGGGIATPPTADYVGYPVGAYSGSVGWVAEDTGDTGSAGRDMAVSVMLPDINATITSIVMIYDRTPGTYVNNAGVWNISHDGNSMSRGTTLAEVDYPTNPSGTGLTASWSGSVFASNIVISVFGSHVFSGQASGGGSATITHLVITEAAPCESATPTFTPSITPTPSNTPTFVPSPTVTLYPTNTVPAVTPSATRIPVTFPPTWTPFVPATLPPTTTPFPTVTPGGPTVTLTPTLTPSLTPTITPTFTSITDPPANGLPGGLWDWLIQFINGLFGLLINIFQQVLSWLRDFLNLISGITLAWNNATATPIVGTPHCATDRFASEVCAIYYILTYTIFSPGTIGALIIPFGTAGVYGAVLFTIAKRIMEIFNIVKGIIRS